MELAIDFAAQADISFPNHLAATMHEWGLRHLVVDSENDTAVCICSRNATLHADPTQNFGWLIPIRRGWNTFFPAGGRWLNLRKDLFDIDLEEEGEMFADKFHVGPLAGGD